jgi:hypothetical protein
MPGSIGRVLVPSAGPPGPGGVEPAFGAAPHHRPGSRRAVLIRREVLVTGGARGRGTGGPGSLGRPRIAPALNPSAPRLLAGASGLGEVAERATTAVRLQSVEHRGQRGQPVAVVGGHHFAPSSVSPG